MRLNHTILQVIPRLEAGGAERSTVEIASEIVRAGGRALVATHKGRMARDVIAAGGEVIFSPVHSKNPLTIWRNAARLTNIINEKEVDLIHARSRAPAWSSLLAARRTGVKFVTTYHGAHRAQNAVKRFYNSSLVRSDRVIANSNFTAEAICQAYDLQNDKVQVIPRGVDLDLFQPAMVVEGRVAELLATWSLPGENNAIRILLPARLTSWKGHEIAIKAISILKSRTGSGKSPNLSVVFCGGVQNNNDYEVFLRAKLDERGVRDMVHIVGDCADMPAAYSWADIVISPSVRPEAFGRVAIEAGAMGKPIIAAAHGGALETVVNGESGVLVKPGDAVELADAIEQLQQMSVETRMSMGDNARARVGRLYSAQAMCDATLDVYRDLLGSGAGYN